MLDASRNAGSDDNPVAEYFIDRSRCGLLRVAAFSAFRAHCATASTSRTGAAVAVKRLFGDGATGAGNREFHAELEVGDLSHPNLTRLFDY